MHDQKSWLAVRASRTATQLWNTLLVPRMQAPVGGGRGFRAKKAPATVGPVALLRLAYRPQPPEDEALLSSRHPIPAGRPLAQGARDQLIRRRRRNESSASEASSCWPACAESFGRPPARARPRGSRSNRRALAWVRGRGRGRGPSCDRGPRGLRPVMVPPMLSCRRARAGREKGLKWEKRQPARNHLRAPPRTRETCGPDAHRRAAALPPHGAVRRPTRARATSRLAAPPLPAAAQAAPPTRTARRTRARRRLVHRGASTRRSPPLPLPSPPPSSSAIGRRARAPSACRGRRAARPALAPRRGGSCAPPAGGRARAGELGEEALREDGGKGGSVGGAEQVVRGGQGRGEGLRAGAPVLPTPALTTRDGSAIERPRSRPRAAGLPKKGGGREGGSSRPSGTYDKR